MSIFKKLIAFIISIFGTKPTKEPHVYFRTKNGVYTKVTGPKTFLKSSWFSGEYQMTEETLNVRTCAEVFAGSEWKATTEKKWDAHMEPLSASGTGTRSGKPIEFVFESDGVKYFKYAEDLDMPIGRHREMEAVYLEYSAQADREYLRKIPDVIEACINSSPIVITEMAQIARDMKMRLNLTFDFSLYEKLASVLYFDMEEDTSKWDVMHNTAKIKRWRETGGMDFFLSMPISDLLPKGFSSSEDLKTYSEKGKIQAALLNSRLEEAYKRLSTAQKGSSSGKAK